MKFVITFIPCFFIGLLFGQDTIRTYHDANQKKLKTQHITQTSYENGALFHGDFIEFYENGKTKSKGSYALGQLHGPYSEYSDKGTMSMECRYTNGILNGEHKTYYPSGNIKERKLFINGKIQGDYKFYADIANSEPIKIEKFQMGNKL
jgi:antitoxin component YwqK of YwqJK toxin-antitoxin module